MSKSIIDVAISLLFYRKKVLVGWRNIDQHQGNKYEFPGGKLEEGETAERACRRETREEVGIDIKQWHAFDVIHHDYEDVEIYLHIFHAHVPKQSLANIQNPWTWYHRDELLSLNFPKANKKIVERLYWSQHIKISEHLANYKPKQFSQLFYWRVNADLSAVEQIKHFNINDFSQLIINIDLWKLLPDDIQKEIITIHFKQYQLLDLALDQLPTGVRCIAACHDIASLNHAQNLGFDAVILSPVLVTQTHPEAVTIGWEKFAEYVKNIDIPVFALGGLTPDDLHIAQQNGAYGIAGIV